MVGEGLFVCGHAIHSFNTRSSWLMLADSLEIVFSCEHNLLIRLNLETVTSLFQLLVIY